MTELLVFLNYYLELQSLITRDVPDLTFPNFGWICELKSGRSQNRIWEFSST